MFSKRFNFTFCVLAFVYCYFLLYHLAFTSFSGDDLAIKNVFNGIKTLADYVRHWTNQYKVWSGRIIIEMTWMQICSLPLVIWQIINPLFYCAIVYVSTKAINLLIPNLERFSAVICAISLCLLFPINDLRTSGWVAGGVTNLWNAVASFYAIYVLLAYSFYKINFSKPVFYIALIYGANAELTLIPIFLVALTLIIIKGYYKDLSRTLTISFLITLVFLANALLCPGNMARFYSETASWFPNFATLSIFDKTLLGMTSTFERFFNLDAYWTRQISLVYLSIITCIWIQCHIFYRKLAIDILMAIPFLGFVLQRYWVNVLDYAAYRETINSLAIFRTQYVLPFIYCWMCFSINIVGIFLTTLRNCNLKISILVSLFFIFAFCSRFTVSVSPTIYASSWRTFVFLNIGLIFFESLLVLGSFKLLLYSVQNPQS